jgi:hypothetical protein
MGLFSSIVTWPLAPVRGVVKLGEVIQRRAEQEMRNPANTRRQLEALEEARKRGEISPEAEDQAQDEIVETRIGQAQPGNAPTENG